MGNIETAMKFSRLKSISSIEDNYTEAATGGVLQKAALKNFAIFTGKQLRWSLLLIKLKRLKRDSNTGIFCAYCEFLSNFKNIYELLLLIILLL